MRVAILGTGLIGASIGLGLRERFGDIHVVGYDRERSAVTEAEKRGAIHERARSAAEAVRGADLVVISVPVLAIRSVLEEIQDDLPAGAVVTDTGSSKAEILRWAREILPEHRGFVAGHPMAGKTEFGPSAAEATLFEGARWVVVPSVSASEEALSLVTGLAETLGARTMVMDAEEHDAYVAAISHLPMMAAIALFSMGRASEAWPEMSLLAAGGFKDMTRLAATDPNMAYDIAITNRDNIAHWLDRYITVLQELRTRLSDPASDDDLFRMIAATEEEYVRYRAGKVGREERDERPVEDHSFADFFTGSWLRERSMQAMRESEERLRQAQSEARSRRRL